MQSGTMLGALIIAAVLAVQLASVAATHKSADLACTDWKVQTLSQLSIPPGAPVRKYYIKAEVVNWKYTPLGFDACFSFGIPGSNANAVVQKARYIQYTDGSFTKKKKRTPDEVHLGILGPIIRAIEGEYIQVEFRNALPFAVNLEPSGVKYADPPTVAPGGAVTLVWATPQSTSSCIPDGETSHMWHYRSTVDPVAHNAAGLFGPIVITRKAAALPNAKPKGVDRELFIVLLRFADYLVPTQIRPPGVPIPQADPQMNHTVNGMTYCNLPGMESKFGDNVRWYVMGLGNEDDLHVAHWHGVTVNRKGRRNVDSLVIVPGVTYTVNSIADNPGKWLFHCHINHHVALGMGAFYTIRGKPYVTAPGPQPGGKIRKYYIAAEAVEWDFAPSGGNLCPNGKTPVPFNDVQKVWTQGNGFDRIGRKYLKALYIEYTDATFTTKKPRPPSEEHIGVQGPLIYAEVGDQIRVLFKNKIERHNVSIHPHGVLYAKDSEGAPYSDGNPNKADDIVQTGQVHLYNWAVPERAGPGANDPSSIMWIYHSHVDEPMDTEAGLIGTLIVTRRGQAKPSGKPKGVDRNLVLAFTVFDESASILLAENAVKYLGRPQSLLDQVEALHIPQLTFIPDGINAQTDLVLKSIYGGSYTPEQDASFRESNNKHTINGYFFCNLPKLTSRIGETTRLYVSVYGDVIDYHSPNLFVGNFLENGLNEQSLRLLPGAMTSVDLKTSQPGSWIFQCHVNDHIVAGMRARLQVAGTATLPAPGTGVVRTYYIASKKLVWNYVPKGLDICSGQPFTPEQQVFTQDFIGSTYVKAKFFQYTNRSFKTEMKQPGTDGILGPSIKAEVGDTIKIVFSNKVREFRTSLKVLSGLVPVCYTVGGKTVRGAAAVNKKLEAGVKVGEVVTFEWVVPATAGPKQLDKAGFVAYTYLSGVDEIGQTHAGLAGLVLIGKKGVFPVPYGDWKQVPAPSPFRDFLYPLLYNIFDETQSPFINQNIARAGLQPSVKTDPAFIESNQKHTMNGNLYCNLPALRLREGQQGVVVLAGLGTENGMHGPIFEGQELEVANGGVLAEVIMPTSTQVATMVAGIRGKDWHGYCYVHDHYTAGMRIRMSVSAY